MSETPSFLIESAAVEPFFKNGYVVVCTRSGAATIIDPGDEASRLNEWVRLNGYKLVSIILTHAHLDHICGVGLIKRDWNVPVYLHPDDAFLYERLEEQARSLGMHYSAAPPYDRELSEGQELRFGDLTFKVILTPGHSPGHVSFILEDHVFCGDVIFEGSIGRTDLPGGSYDILLETIRARILPLGDEKILLPGHGPKTTVGKERATNPFLKQP